VGTDAEVRGNRGVREMDSMGQVIAEGSKKLSEYGQFGRGIKPAEPVEIFSLELELADALRNLHRLGVPASRVASLLSEATGHKFVASES
jgi:hypothetical protein